MARLEFDITGNNSGLAQAAQQSIGILESLQNVADGLKIDLFKATTVDGINNIGAALTRVTGNIKDYINNAVKGSQAWQDQTAANTLDALATKLLAINGNAVLFGTTIKNQQQEIAAYQAAITRLLSAGIDPLDSRIQGLKANIDSLTSSIQAQNDAAARSKFGAQFQDTGSLILDAQRKVERLGLALQNATSERQIIQYNNRLREAEGELSRLTTLGQAATNSTNNLGQSANRAGRQFSSVGIEFSRIIQDAPFAFKALGAGQNNFGAIGNNITRLTELIPGYILQLKAAIVAQGGVATSANVAKAAFAGMFTGIGGLIFAVSAAVSIFTVYQAIQQKNAREAENNANALQKQKKALDDYILSLSAASQTASKATDGYAAEIAKLDFLFAAIQKNTDARYGNTTAVQELQKLYPEIFGSLTKNEFLVNATTAAYLKLRDSIIQTATVQAAFKLADEALQSNIKNTVALAGATGQAKQDLAEYNALLAKRNDLLAKRNTKANAGGELEGQITATTVLLNQQFDKVQAAIKTQQGYQAETKKSADQVGAFFKAAANAQDLLNKSQPKKSGLIFDLEERLKQLQANQPTIKIKADLDLNVAEIKKVQAQIDKLQGKTKKGPADTSAQNQLSLTESLRALSQRSEASGLVPDLAGAYADQKTKIETTYADLFGDLAAIEQKITNNTKINATQRTADLQQVANLRIKLESDQLNAISQLNIKDAQNTANEVERIRNDSGVKSTVTREKELSQIQAWYDAEVIKAKDNEEILAALREGRAARIQAVNDKYLAVEEDLFSKIRSIEDTANGAAKGIDADRTAQINKEWDKRLKDATKYYDQLRQLQGAGIDPFGVLPSGVGKGIQGLAGQPNLDAAQSATNKAITKGRNADLSADLNKELTQGLSRGIKSFTNDVYETFSTLNQQTDKSFTTIFSSLTSKLQATVSNIFLNIVSDGLSKALKDGISKGVSGLSGELKGVIGGLAIAGGLVSGLTPKTSSIGQGVGGALSGAAAGAVAGSVIPGLGTLAGGLIGGGIGAIGGLFGSKKARKEAEALQKQQLEEAKKQTELLRQQALAYTSSIIGKQTTNGIITGVDINAFGELTAKVSGKDLQFVLDRNSQSR